MKKSNNHKGANPEMVRYANPGIAREMPTANLNSGQPYQRPVKPSDVNALIQRWDPAYLSPIEVSFRDGSYNVINGQHRIEAMRKMNGGADVIVPCLIYTGLSYEQEAELYFKLDQSKGRLRLSHATKALLESGTDAEVLEIKRLVESAGFVWVLDKKSGDAYEILSTRAIINAYRLLGGAAFSRLLVLLDSTWHGASISLRASMLSGMALFLKTYETELDDRTFIKRLSAVDPEEIIRRGKMDFSTNKAALRFARVILEKYNTQQRGGRKLPYRFKG